MTSAIGVDIGGTKITVARVDRDGHILAERVVPTPANNADAFAAIDATIATLDAADVRAIGVGVPGRVDAKTGDILSGGYVNLAREPLSTRLRSVAARPLAVDNDAAMALVAETRVGAGRGATNIVLAAIGTGIGGAALNDGRLVHGAACAGQFGHITVNYEGAPCACGRRGCFEAEAAGPALARLVREAGLDASTTAEALLADDRPPARMVVARWAAALRAGVDSLIAAFDPELVILGGGRGAAAVEALRRAPGVSPWFQRPIVAAELGDRAGAIGAALAALERAP
jgi:glucokinase